MSERARRKFTEEFKREAVALWRGSGKSVSQIAKDLDLTEQSLRRWAMLAEQGERSAVGEAGESERVELLRLRKENRVLRMERDFLKKAAAFFAKENP